MVDSTDMAVNSMATMDYIPNPDFSFPAQPDHSSYPPQHHGPRRTASLHLNPSTPQRISALERRSASTLPTFSFNASDTSGRAESPAGDSEVMEPTPSLSGRSMGHRRGASEFIGGNGRNGGAPDLITVSPMKGLDGAVIAPHNAAAAAAMGSPMRKRGHSHKRSLAMPANDVSSILQPRDANIMSNQGTDSLLQPTSLYQDLLAINDPQGPPPAPAFPIGRPRVGFSSNIEIIPRPLSTISSEAESIISGTGAQSPSGSATSPRQSGAFSPTGKRKSRSARSSLAEVEFATQLKGLSEDHDIDDDDEENSEAGLSSIDADTAFNTSSNQHSQWFENHPAFNLDRRSSEPTLSFGSLQKPRRSSISLREPLTSDQIAVPEAEVVVAGVKRKSSASRVKAWASSVMQRKEKKAAKMPMMIDIGPRSDDITPSQDDCTPMSEADLEELFNQDPFGQPDDDQANPLELGTRMDMATLKDFNPTFGDSDDGDGQVIDLDAAMGSSQTPSRDGKSPGFGARRQMHSSRMNRDFNSPVTIYHRRAESAPALTPFDYVSSASPMHSPMADVFEEDEEEEPIKAVHNLERATAPAFSFPQAPLPKQSEADAVDDGLGIRNDVTVAPPIPTANLMLSEPHVLEEEIMEGLGPIEIVEAHEEPRTSTLTKSSTSSDTATLAADVGTALGPQPVSINTMTPTTAGESAFSSPDVSRRQTSFDLPRLGTSASSAAECRTMSSFASERPETRPSVDDVPSLTSSRSTMISSMHHSRRDVTERPGSTKSQQLSEEQQEQRRRKRSSIQSLTKLMSGPFGESKNRLNLEHDNASSPDLGNGKQSGRKREKRLSKLMFWRGKSSRGDNSRS
ncbi:hypothetical protein ANO11243_001360 [Dothideomycetidae sp. 11243]|nr:hypothetical protein ANO11243_001360 [fungal sp. No.11243]